MHGLHALRLDEIAADAELQEKSPSELQQLAHVLHSGCLEADQAGGVALKVGGVSMNAAAILKRVEALAVLARVLPSTRAARRR